MLADPQSITVGAATIPIPRTGLDKNSADYQSADGTTRMRVSQSTTGTARRTAISLQTSKIAADPVSAVQSRKTQQVTISFSGPLDGFTITELKDQLKGLSDLLSASSYAKLVQILGGEK
jgi:hypothetical protein